MIKIPEVTPIILIGMNRTGTKWVSNLLCNHEDIIGVQSERARGILETNMFGTMQEKFDLSFPDEYVGFLELWANTEFFKVAGGDKEEFYKLDPRPRDALRMFEILMSDYASRNDKRYWLQKTSPRTAENVLQYFKNAKVVITRRNLFDTVKSTLGLQRKLGQRKLLRATYAYVRQRKELDEFSKRFNAVEVEYENLRRDTASEAARLLRELGLPVGTTSTEVPFEKNTSFSSGRERERIVSRKEYFVIRLVAFGAGLIPLIVMRLATKFKARIVGKRRRFYLLPGSFGPLFDKLHDKSRG
jgi:hypothetical protein